MENKEKEQIARDVLKKFIYKIRTTNIPSIVYRYYISDKSQALESNRVKVKEDFDSIKLQISREILSEKNNYWQLKDSDIEVAEKYLMEEKNINSLKTYINALLGVNLKEQSVEMEAIQKAELEAEKQIILDAIESNDENLYKAVFIVIENKREFPYKSSKVDALLELKLNEEQIVEVLKNYDNLKVTKGYVGQIAKKRFEEICDNKRRILTQEEKISQILNL